MSWFCFEVGVGVVCVPEDDSVWEGSLHSEGPLPGTNTPGSGLLCMRCWSYRGHCAGDSASLAAVAKTLDKALCGVGGGGGGQGPICLNVSSKAVFQDLYIWCVLFSYMYIFY